MALAHVNYYNKALQKQVGFYALLPDIDSPGPFPVYYLLHGMSDDYTAWLRWTSIERYVRNLPLIVVLPDGDRFSYSDHPNGPQYEKALVADLIPYVDRIFPTIPEGQSRVIGGLSMGGYGSMKLALKYPDMFCSVAAHSGAYRRANDGKWPMTEDDSVFNLAEKLDRKKTPAIRFDCGVDDFLIEHNRNFHAYLQEIGLPHEYEEFPGEHNWDYWDVHVQEALAFHCKALGIER
jgi:putative tributyrin esterase